MNQPVFPSQYLLPENQGMSLRDYFAAKAMQSLLIRKEYDDTSANDLAIDAYNLADAMLLAREA